MRVWVVVSIGVAILGLGALAYAAVPGFSSGVSGMGGGGFAFGCGHVVYGDGSGDMPPADFDRTFEYRPGDVFRLPFPPGRHYAILEYSGGDVVFLGSKPEPMSHHETACPEEPSTVQVRGLDAGSGRFRVWIPTNGTAG